MESTGLDSCRSLFNRMAAASRGGHGQSGFYLVITPIFKELEELRCNTMLFEHFLQLEASTRRMMHPSVDGGEPWPCFDHPINLLFADLLP